MDDRQDGRGFDPVRGAGRLICIAAAAGALWLVFRYAWSAAVPFLLAYLLSRLIRPLVGWVCRGGRIPRGVASAVLVLLFVGGVSALAVSGVRRGVDELGRLISELAADTDGVVAAVGLLVERAGAISEHIPLLRQFENTPGFAAFCERLDGFVESGIDRIVTSVGSALPDAAMTVAGWLPDAFVFVTVLFLACYYFSADDGTLADGFRRRMAAWIPETWRDRLIPLGRRLCRLVRQYLRAHLLLGFFTFLAVFIGLAVLGVPYAFILAVLIAFVDILPLLGTGVVLVPWGIVCLLLGEIGLGVGLLVLCGVCTLLRQLLEPKFLGRELGLHPLLSLASVYAGLRLFGIWGMLLGPLLVAAAAEILPRPSREAAGS